MRGKPVALHEQGEGLGEGQGHGVPRKRDRTGTDNEAFEGGAKEAPVPCGWRYFFSVTTSMTAAAGGEIPSGYRMDLAYDEGEVTTKADLYDGSWLRVPVPALTQKFHQLEGYADLKAKMGLPSVEQILKDEQNKGTLEWFGLEGKLISGTDWAVVRRDAVVQFDGRVTLRSQEATNDESVLISAYLTGAVDLRWRGNLPATSLKDVSSLYQTWKAGQFEAKDHLKVVLGIRFDAAQASQPWAAPEFRKAEKNFWRYKRLMRGHFIAVGEATLKRAAFMPVERIALDIYEVNAP